MGKRTAPTVGRRAPPVMFGTPGVASLQPAQALGRAVPTELRRGTRACALVAGDKTNETHEALIPPQVRSGVLFDRLDRTPA
jgi:hypothetical protein